MENKEQIQELPGKWNQEDLVTAWLGGWSLAHFPDFGLDGCSGAIRKSRRRNEFYEGSNHSYEGQTAFEVLVGHSAKDL